MKIRVSSDAADWFLGILIAPFLILGIALLVVAPICGIVNVCAIYQGTVEAFSEGFYWGIFGASLTTLVGGFFFAQILRMAIFPEPSTSFYYYTPPYTPSKLEQALVPIVYLGVIALAIGMCVVGFLTAGTLLSTISFIVFFALGWALAIATAILVPIFA